MITSQSHPHLIDALKKIIADTGATPGSVVRVHIEHEKWCAETDGTGRCACVPICTVGCDKGEFTYKLIPDPEG
jgi:hypothetical protein